MRIYKTERDLKVVSTETRSKDLKFGINFNNLYLIIIPINKRGKKSIIHWYVQTYMMKEVREFSEEEIWFKLHKLIMTHNNYEFIIEKKEAYKEYLNIYHQAKQSNLLKDSPQAKYPPKPNKDLFMLEDWYFKILEIDKTDHLLEEIDNSSETLIFFEIDLIEIILQEINREFINPELDSKRPDKKEIIINKAFSKWLQERKTELMQKKIYVEEESEKKIKGIKNWNKKIRTYLLLEIGIDSLEKFKKLSQGSKHLLIANILNCSERKVEEYYNHSRQTLSLEKKDEVKEFLDKLNKK